MEEWTPGKQGIRATGTKNDKILVLREVDKKSVLIEDTPPAVYGQRPLRKDGNMPRVPAPPYTDGSGRGWRVGEQS
jgi:hypothetical protein